MTMIMNMIMVVWLSNWESFMVSNLLAKVGGHKHCDSTDMFLMEQDSTCLSEFAITIYL